MSQKKRSDSNFMMQGSILAIASIISRVIGLLYRAPLTDIIGKTGNDFYGTAYEVYNIILIISKAGKKDIPFIPSDFTVENSTF